MPGGGRRLDHLPALDSQQGTGIDEGLGDVDDFNFGAGNLEVGQDALGDPFVDERPQALGVVGELDDIVMAIGCGKEMSLRASAKGAQPGSGGYWHGRCAKVGWLWLNRQILHKIAQRRIIPKLRSI